MTILSFSRRTQNFIRDNIDQIFLSDIHDHCCSTSPSGVTVCHLAPSTCWMTLGFLKGITCADTVDTPTTFAAVEKDPTFLEASEQKNFTSCLLKMGDHKLVLYRHFDEGGHGMTQWDRVVPDDIWSEMVPVAKKYKGAYYEVPFVFPTRLKKSGVN